MNRNSFTAGFARTWVKIYQMVMATDYSSTGNMDEPKSDLSLVDNKIAPNAVSQKVEKHFTRVLRSKSFTVVSSTCSNSEIQKEQPQSSASSPEAQVVQDVSNHKSESCQAAHLRQLLLLHLELIQQQQEELQKKEREITQLKLDKEQLESRMHRLERRMAVKKRRDSNAEFVENLSDEKPAKLTVPKSRRLSVEQMVRGKRVPATSSVTMTSHMCDDISYDTHLRTEMLYLHNDHLTDFSEQTVDKSKDKGSSHVQVPTWHLSELSPSKPSNSKSLRTTGSVSCNETIESIDDELFAKRHMKHEIEEKRRKRWDIQHMRAIQQHQTLEKKSRDREDARLKGRKSACLDRDAKNVESFLPAAENVMAVEVSDTVPVVAFGYPVPLFHNREFEVPWFSVDRRELQERKGKARPGRTRGKSRGRRAGTKKGQKNQ